MTTPWAFTGTVRRHLRGWNPGVCAIAALSLFAWAGRALADSTPITVGSAGNYGLLSGAGDTLTLSGGFNLSGNAGIGQNGTVNLTGGNAISGTAFEDSGVTTNSDGNTSVSGGVITQSMTQALADATTASNAAAAMTATAGLTDQGGAINLNGGSVTIQALGNLSENVLNISALSLTNGTLTFDDNGYTGAKFIVNVTGNFNVGSTGGGTSIIQGINGASASDIIFNIENPDSSVSITGNSTNQVIGTILDPSSSVTLGGGGTLTGALLAGFNNARSATTVQAGSDGFNINSFAYTPQAGSSSVPEPSSIAMFGAGLVAVAALARRRRGSATEL
jgi:hypothetical protein